MKKLRTLLLFLAIVPASSLAQYPPVPRDFSGCPEYASFLEYARIFADTLLRAGIDHFGPKHTPMFLQMLSLKTNEPPTQENNPSVGLGRTSKLRLFSGANFPPPAGNGTGAPTVGIILAN
jgi:hypothetical protein